VYEELLAKLFAAIDRKDADAFVECLTDDASFRFGSAPAVAGRDGIREAVAAFFATIAGLSHRLNEPIAHGDTLVCEGAVTYIRHDGSEITLPFANVFEMDGGLIRNYKIYADIGPLYAE